MAQPQNLPRKLSSSQVLARFGVQMGILLAFASFGGIGFARSLATLMWMAVVFTGFVAIVKRERPFGDALNHWDEVVAYAAIFCLISAFDHPMPGGRWISYTALMQSPLRLSRIHTWWHTLRTIGGRR